MKIAVIGAGSVGFTRKLVRDLLKVEVFRDAEFALHDISEANLSMIAQLLQRDVENVFTRCMRSRQRFPCCL